MKTGEQFIVLDIAEVVPDSRYTIWTCLAAHTKRKGTLQETVVLWGCNPHDDTYIIVDRRYVERVN